MNRVAYDHLLKKALAADLNGEAALARQSADERVAVALVLNRADWLERMSYTMAEAIDHLEPDWLAALPEVERALHENRALRPEATRVQ